MKLGGYAIRRALTGNVWRAYRGNQILEADDLRIGPNSVDVTLDRRIIVPNILTTENLPVDPFLSNETNYLLWDNAQCSGDGYVLHPGKFVLGAVRERFLCREPLLDTHGYYRLYAPMYEGRSTCGRIGLMSHVTAGFGDYGFCGAFTLEIYNVFPRPIILREGMRIGQVAFEAVEDPMTYEGQYSGGDHYEGPVIPVLGRHRFVV